MTIRCGDDCSVKHTKLNDKLQQEAPQCTNLQYTLDTRVLHYTTFPCNFPSSPLPPWRPRIGQWTHVSVWAHGTMTMGLSCCRQWWCHQMTYWMSSSWRCCASRHLHISLHCEFNSKQTFMLYIRHSDMPQQIDIFVYLCFLCIFVYVYLWHYIFVALCIFSIVYLCICLLYLYWSTYTKSSV